MTAGQSRLERGDAIATLAAGSVMLARFDFVRLRTPSLAGLPAGMRRPPIPIPSGIGTSLHRAPPNTAVTPGVSAELRQVFGPGAFYPTADNLGSRALGLSMARSIRKDRDTGWILQSSRLSVHRTPRAVGIGNLDAGAVAIACGCRIFGLALRHKPGSQTLREVPEGRPCDGRLHAQQHEVIAWQGLREELRVKLAEYEPCLLH